jgi:hypothetical protein
MDEEMTMTHAMIMVGATAVGWALVFLGASVTAAADLQVETFTGSAYDGDLLAASSWPAPLYAVRMVREKGTGVDRLRTVYTDRGGRDFYTQTVDLEGDVPKAYVFSNDASRQAGKLSVTPTELVMELTQDGKTKVAREPRPALFAVGPSVTRIVEAHIGELAAGAGITFRVVALPRLESFAVRVVREPARANETIPEVKAGRWMRLRIEPESAILRLVAPTIQLVVDAKTGRTALMSGPISSPDPAVGMIKKGTVRYHDARP